MPKFRSFCALLIITKIVHRIRASRATVNANDEPAGHRRRQSSIVQSSKDRFYEAYTEGNRQNMTSALVLSSLGLWKLV